MRFSLKNFRYAARALRRRPTYAAVAIGTIGLAIAANTTMFTVFNGVILQPLPYRDAERLVTIDVKAHNGFYISLSLPNYRDWRDKNRTFESFAAGAGWGMTLTGRGQAQAVYAMAVVGDPFGTLGLRPHLGRLLTPEELPDREGAPFVAVLSHAFWQQNFGGQPEAVGQTLVLDEQVYTIVGIMPPGAEFPRGSVDLFLPMGTIPNLPWDDRGSSFGTRAFGRLAPGVNLGAAREDLDRVGQEVRAEAGDDTALPELRTLSDYVIGNVKAPLNILMGAVVFVLLIAVANVGNLMLARGEDRYRELAVRGALGAAKQDVVSLLLAEAFMIAFTGGLLGAGLAYLSIEAVLALLPAQVPDLLLTQVSISGTSLLFALGTALGAGALFGIVPAFRMARGDLVGSLKSGARTTDQGRERLRSALVVGEVAIALMLLIASGLMLRTLDQLRNVDKGFNPESILTASVPISSDRDATRGGWLGFYADLRGQAAAIPGVQSAALTLLLPLEDRSWEMGLHPEGVPVTPETSQSVLYNIVSPDYFEALGVPILRGRGFTESDRQGSNLVAIIDETMAERFWPGTDALGRQITFETDTASNPVYRTVVGVTRNVRHYELTEPSRIQVYVPFEQTGTRWGMGLRVALKTTIPPEEVAGPFRELVAKLDPNTPVSRLRPLDDLVDQAMGQSTSITRLLTAFGASALALAALGIFGVMSYAVTRRQREIGIRIALGAGATEVIRWVATRALRLTALGIVIGLIASMAMTRMLASLLYDVNPVDPFVFAVVSAVLASVALLAAYLPARRATRVDPVVVLSEEG